MDRTQGESDFESQLVKGLNDPGMKMKHNWQERQTDPGVEGNIGIRAIGCGGPGPFMVIFP